MLAFERIGFFSGVFWAFGTVLGEKTRRKNGSETLFAAVTRWVISPQLIPFFKRILLGGISETAWTVSRELEQKKELLNGGKAKEVITE